jgi:putative inorganic carbon (HCO3(-)) transporter
MSLMRPSRFRGFAPAGRDGARLAVGALAAVALGVAVARAGLFGAVVVVLAALAIPLLVALVRRPQRGILALAALAPFNGLYLILPHGHLVKPWKEALVLAVLVASFLTARENRRPPRSGRLPWWLPALVGLLALGTASLAFVGVERWLTGMRVEFFFALAAWAVWRCPLDDRERDRLVTILMATAVATAVVGLAQEALGQARLHALGYQYNSTIRTSHGLLRAFSTFTQPFPFAFYLMLVVAIALPVALGDRGRLRNRLFLWCLPLVGLGMLVTIVRGAWLGLALALAYLAFRRHRALFLLVPVGLLALAFLPGRIEASALSAKSLGERTSGWSDNLHQIVAHPLGDGIGTAGAAAERLDRNAVLAGEVVIGGHRYQPDNEYYLIAFELGVLGAWMLVLLYLSGLAASHQAVARAREPDSALQLGLAAAMVAVIGASAVSTYLEIFPMDLLFWLLLGVAWTTPGAPGALESEADEQVAGAPGNSGLGRR